MRTFTVSELRECAYVEKRWNVPWGFSIETSKKGDTETNIITLRLRDVFERIADCEPIEDPRDVPCTIRQWMSEKNIADMYAFYQAAKSLNKAQKSNLIQKIFNGGGMPEAKRDWHPALLQIFIDWIAMLLCKYDGIDGRISKRGEAIMNAARRAYGDLGPVRRF